MRRAAGEEHTAADPLASTGTFDEIRAPNKSGLQIKILQDQTAIFLPLGQKQISGFAAQPTERPSAMKSAPESSAAINPINPFSGGETMYSIPSATAVSEFVSSLSAELRQDALSQLPERQNLAAQALANQLNVP